MADPDQLLYLHGDLHLHIIEARCLPNMDLFAGHFSRCFTCCNACRTDHGDGYGSDDPGGGGGSHREMKIDHHRNIVTSDSYVTVSVPQATLARTRVLPNSHNPKWNEHFHILLAHPLEFLEFRIKDNDFFGADTMGKVLISAEEIASGKEISGWFTLVNSAGKQPNPEAALHIEMKFTPCDKNPVYRHGIAGDTLQGGVRNTYFPLRRGGSVTLYQDAHVRDEDGLPKIELDNGLDRQHNRCWEDICHAISEAHHLVYIVGWSVFHKVRLIREPTKPLPRGGDMTLGELLKYKSQEGVRVLLLVWDDKTSHDKLLLKTAGMMKTHDEETKKFFKHSSVICVLSPRYASSKLNYFKQQVVGTVFTHHQKCVLVDTQAPGNNRKITAFLGGIDLCDGRYDTPEHRLFNGVETIFKDDFHQPTFPEGLKAPRQPWHDLHCRIDGPAAYDVLVNFAQRWQKATTWKEFSMLKKKMAPRWSDDSMIKIERISWILSPAFSISRSGSYKATSDDDPNLHVSREQDPESWNVQIFRSIDSGSARGFPKYYIEARAQNLDFSKKLVIDRSIQTAYVQAIRSAQNFIYMENQYFLGSSYAWPSYKDAGADHLIPMELAMKIASKIRANERFSVYVVIPMWPEGNPKDNAMQEILFWQAQTMQMMYQYIAKEIKSMQLSDSHPLDYLNFYCLGKREPIAKAAAEVSGGADKISESQKFQRFMIYVHAKGMVVDDEYVIIGSANINQRSMAGSKDTEIAMGAYQPCHTWAKKGDHPRGQVYGYRMSLWAEHLGMLNECFKNPKSLECVKRVNEIGKDNWTKYTQDEFTLLQGHLLKYPIEVDVEGNVNPLPGCENFPDVGGRILGTQSQHMPDIVTT